MNRKVTLVLAICLLFVLAVALAACGGTEETEGPTSTTGAPDTTAGAPDTTDAPPVTEPEPSAETKTLIIGASVSLNGQIGIVSKNQLELYQKITNDAGGLKIGDETYMVDFIMYDDQGDPTKAADNCKRAVLDDGVKFWLESQAAIPPMEIPITEQAKVINIGLDMTGAGAAPDVNYYWTVGGFFTTGLQYGIQKDVIATGVESYISVKPDNDMGHFADMTLTNSWKLAGPNITALGTVFVNPETVDFSAVATKVVSSDPDCVDLAFLGLIANSVPQMYRALADLGYDGIILPGILSQDELDQLVQMVGEETVEGGMVPSYDTSTQTDPRMRAFLDAYNEEYGSVESITTNVMDQVLTLEDGLTRAGSIDVEAVKAAMDEGHPVQSIYGIIQFMARPDLGSTRACSAAPSNPIARIVNGKLENFSFATVKDQYLVTIAANNLVDVYKAYWEEFGYPELPESEAGMDSITWEDIGITGQD